VVQRPFRCSLILFHLKSGYFLSGQWGPLYRTTKGIFNALKIDSVKVAINIDSETDTTTLNGELEGNIALVPTVKEFGIDLKGANLKVEKIGENYTTDISGEIALKGYDPTRSNEKPLILNGWCER
jgi:hypothetical protein